MKTLKIHYYILYSLLALSLASCGFQLKQSSSLPVSFGPVSIHGIGKFSPFYRTVRNALRQSSINIVDGTSANHSIHISPSRERKVLSVNTAGKVSEYELIQHLNYRVTRPDGSMLIEPTKLSRSSYYTASRTEVLGNATEEVDIYIRLEEQLVNQMFEQISVAF
jgi:LPS-assembly lipoprotein